MTSQGVCLSTSKSVSMIKYIFELFSNLSFILIHTEKAFKVSTVNLEKMVLRANKDLKGHKDRKENKVHQYTARFQFYRLKRTPMKQATKKFLHSV